MKYTHVDTTFLLKPHYTHITITLIALLIIIPLLIIISYTSMPRYNIFPKNNNTKTILITTTVLHENNEKSAF